MSTNGMESWAVDLKDVGAIYPFQGSEVLMVIIGCVFWIGWHVIQTRHENARDRGRHGGRPKRRRNPASHRPLLTMDAKRRAGDGAPLVTVFLSQEKLFHAS